MELWKCLGCGGNEVRSVKSASRRTYPVLEYFLNWPLALFRSAYAVEQYSVQLQQKIQD